MNVYDYCETVSLELENWRKKLGDMDLKIARLSCEVKEGMLGNIEELHMVIAEMEDRIESLRSSCPTSWRPTSGEDRVGPISINTEEALKAHADYDFGG